MSPVIQLKHRSPRTNLSHRLDNTYGAPGSDKVYGTLRSGIRNKHSRRRDPVAAINACLRRRNPYRVDRRELNAEKAMPAESQALIRRLIHQAIHISAAVSRGTTLGISRLQSRRKDAGGAPCDCALLRWRSNTQNRENAQIRNESEENRASGIALPFPQDLASPTRSKPCATCAFRWTKMWISFDYRSDKQASQPGHDIPDRPAQAVKPAHLSTASAGTSILCASPTAAPDHHLVHRLLRVGRPPPFVHNTQSQWMGGQSSCSSPVLCAIILSAEARTPAGNADRRLWKSRLPIRAVKFLHMKSAAVLEDAR